MPPPASALSHSRRVVGRLRPRPPRAYRGMRQTCIGLVLGCIKANICKYILVGKLSPRSTQCTPLHRSLISKISLKSAVFFSAFFPKIRKFCQNFAEFSPNVTKFFRDFSKMQHFSKNIQNVQYFSWNILEKLPIFSEKSGIFRTRNCKKSDSVNHIPSVL